MNPFRFGLVLGTASLALLVALYAGLEDHGVAASHSQRKAPLRRMTRSASYRENEPSSFSVPRVVYERPKWNREPREDQKRRYTGSQRQQDQESQAFRQQEAESRRRQRRERAVRAR